MNDQKIKKNTVYIVIIVISFLACIAMAVSYISGNKKNEAPAMVSQETSKQPETVIKEQIVEVKRTITGSIIQEGLREMGVLITQEYYFTEVIDEKKTNTIWGYEIGFTEASIVASYDGTITAGVDFSKIEVEKDEEQKTITIRIPKSAIVSTEIDQDSFRVYSEKTSSFNKITLTDFNEAQKELKLTAQERAIEKGLLTRADQNAEKMILNFVNGILEDSGEFLINCELVDAET